MRTIEVDQFEFDDPQSEEHLEIATSRRSEWVPTIAVFACEVGYKAVDAPPTPKGRVDIVAYLNQSAPSLPASDPLCEVHGHRKVLLHLKQFAGIDAPEPCLWASWIMPSNERYAEENLLIETEDGFVSYKWSCSA